MAGELSTNEPTMIVIVMAFDAVFKTDDKIINNVKIVLF
jgi:hypothetical protein